MLFKPQSVGFGDTAQCGITQGNKQRQMVTAQQADILNQQLGGDAANEIRKHHDQAASAQPGQQMAYAESVVGFMLGITQTRRSRPQLRKARPTRLRR